MIRVNLLNNYASGAAPTASVVNATPPTQTSPFSLSSPEGLKPEVMVALKFLILFVPITLLIGYESQNITSLQNKLQTTQAELTQSKNEVEMLKPEVEAVKKFQENKTALQARINTIRELSKERLKNVKALDSLQSLMPTKAWLTELKFTGDQVQLTGQAVEVIDVSLLTQGLEESVFFTGVSLISDEADRTKDGVLRKFKISARLENM